MVTVNCLESPSLQPHLSDVISSDLLSYMTLLCCAIYTHRNKVLFESHPSSPENVLQVFHSAKAASLSMVEQTQPPLEAGVNPQTLEIHSETRERTELYAREFC